MPLRLAVEAKPGKKVASLTVRDGILVVAVRERAVDGRANTAIERAIAVWLGVPARSVTIVLGASTRRKLVEVDVDPEVVARRIADVGDR
jgi:hypothetical protein